MDNSYFRAIRDLERKIGKAVIGETPSPSFGEVIGQFLGIDGLRFLYPVSSRNENNGLIDVSGQAKHLTLAGGVTFGVTNRGAVYATYNGTTGYHYRASETNNNPTYDMTLGGWVYPTSLPSAGPIISKDDVAGNRSFQLILTSATFQVYFFSPTATNSGVSGGVSAVANNWFFVVGRFTPSTEVALFVNGNKAINTTSIISSIKITSTQFDVARDEYTTPRYFPGRITLPFVSATALSDTTINRLFSMSRGLFGV